MPQESNDYRIIVFGGAAVGKSSLVQRFVSGSFKEAHVPTVEDTYRKVVSSNRQVCTLQITDTTGSHQFPAMQRLAMQRGQAYVLVYSVTSRQSFEIAKTIYSEILEVKGDLSVTPVVVAGNKSDEGDGQRREVTQAEGASLAAQWKCGFLETSAKANKNVVELFEQLLQLEKRRVMTLDVGSSRKSKGRKKEAGAAAGKQRSASAPPLGRKSAAAPGPSAVGSKAAPSRVNAIVSPKLGGGGGQKSAKQSASAGTAAVATAKKQATTASAGAKQPQTSAADQSKEKCDVM